MTNETLSTWTNDDLQTFKTWSDSSHFQRLRGRLDLDPERPDLILRLPNPLYEGGKVTVNPDANTTMIRRQLGEDAEAVLGLLREHRKQGRDKIAAEVIRALFDSHHKLPGETWSDDQLQTWTLLIPDFRATLTWIRWVRCSHWGSLDQYLDELAGKSTQEHWTESLNRHLTVKLFETFPSLVNHSRERRRQGGYQGWDLNEARQDRLGTRPNLPVGTIPLRLAWETYNDHLEIADGSLGWLIPGGEEVKDWLKGLPEAQRPLAAAWTLRLPRWMSEEKNPQEGEICRTYFGFHPDEDHGHWLQANQNFSGSERPRCGYQVVAMNRRITRSPLDHTRRTNPEGSIAQVCLTSPDDLLAFELEPMI